jgi:hypothetical protein
MFASDYALWHPKWLVEMFVDFQIPGDDSSELPQLTPDVKRKILGLNAARLYDLPVPAEVPQPQPAAQDAGPEVTEKPAVEV